MNYQEKEMELLDYLKILANSRRILGLSFLVATLIGVCFAVILPKYYTITSIIGFAGAPIQPSSVVEKIKEGVYEECVLKMLGREKLPAGFEMKTVLLIKSPAMKISVKTPHLELAFGKAYLQELFEIIDKENKDIIEIYKNRQAKNNKKKEIELKLAILDKKLKDQERHLNYLEGKLKLLDEQQMELENESSVARKERNKAKRVNGTALLKDQINAISKKRDNIALSIEVTHKTINKITTDVKLKTIELLYQNKDNPIIDNPIIEYEIVKTGDIKIISGPEIKPAKSKALLIVLIFAVLGLGIGVLLALMIEYLRQEKEKRNNENNIQ